MVTPNSGSVGDGYGSGCVVMMILLLLLAVVVVAFAI